jgi:hypothetical protein
MGNPTLLARHLLNNVPSQRTMGLHNGDLVLRFVLRRYPLVNYILYVLILVLILGQFTFLFIVGLRPKINQ